MSDTLPQAVSELLERAHRLGADPRNTNYAGGNTSAKATATDPVTGRPVELMWVKGSGGDLGTLTAAGLAVLRVDRLRALVGVYGQNHSAIAFYKHVGFTVIGARKFRVGATLHDDLVLALDLAEWRG